MTERILDECSRRGTCPLNRREFDETFSGQDLTIQVRAALDFAQQHDLAFARSTGDQFFVFSRLAKLQPGTRGHPANARRERRPQNQRRSGGKRRSKGSSQRPIGRSF